MPGLRRVARILLAAVLLAGQQLALHHQVWHAGAAVVADGGAPKPGPERNPLCDQHAALGAVLGAIGCAAAHEAPAALAAAAISAEPFAARDNAPLSPSSRDPPRAL
jgi:hypothetical protein